MLKIKLPPPVFLHNKYEIFIIENVRKSFSNKRIAEDFIRKFEQVFTESVLFINEEYSNLHSFYRTYFIADRDFKWKYEVETSFNFINNRMQYISIHTHSANYNTMIHQAILNCISELLDVCGLICRKANQRYDCITKNRIQLRHTIIELYRNEVLDWEDFMVYDRKPKIKLKAV